MVPKYRIVISEGCTAFWTTVNDKMVRDLSKEEFETFLDYILAKIKEGVVNNEASIDTVIRCLRETENEYDSESCEQCGDNVSRSIWEI